MLQQAIWGGARGVLVLSQHSRGRQPTVCVCALTSPLFIFRLKFRIRQLQPCWGVGVSVGGCGWQEAFTVGLVIPTLTNNPADQPGDPLKGPTLRLRTLLTFTVPPPPPFSAAAAAAAGAPSDSRLPSPWLQPDNNVAFMKVVIHWLKIKTVIRTARVPAGATSRSHDAMFPRQEITHWSGVSAPGAGLS